MKNATINTSSLLKAIPMAAGLGALLNAVLFWVGSSVGIIDPNAGMPKPEGGVEPITLVAVVVSSILPVIIAGGVLALINRFSNNPLRVFGILTIVLTLLSLINPFVALPDAPLGMKLLLNAMHFVVAGSVWYFFSRSTKAA